MQRRIDLGLEPPTSTFVPTPINWSKQEKDARELAGGWIVIGRAAFKEYMEGMRRGWSESPARIDREDALAHILEDDGHFDEPELPELTGDLEGEPIPTKSRLLPSKSTQVFSPINPVARSVPRSSSSIELDGSVISPPATIPPQPPLLLVPFTNIIGLKQIPLMIVDFFNQRAKVITGAEAAYRLVTASIRPISAPLQEASLVSLASSDEQRPETDLDFDRESESYYPGSTSAFLQNIEKQRDEYYKSLATKLATARALAHGEREPTKEEQAYPPPTEVELRAERLKKEMRWRNDEEGWKIIRPEAAVAWDDRFREILSIFVDSF